ncbi:TfuA-like protein [Streptomyces sp. S.PNR 29]|uniref:TfuA-like protein n=1 Tax=Streptomyces sp. S.PNR 29 TaxID=2973805 RepID=UPI0025B15FD9|nr:TfuA-like protein [Streptomyces sp. S.PNR 29]MDN0195310.1 TfuA-like protein [Streptomyces sp. S.PNR 29]
MRAVVFCGPSLSHADARRVLDAEYLPPVGKGDLDRLLADERPPDLIGIVDGRFFQSLSVSPKEILRVLDAGIAVYGSSSMGALRAVECAPYGMVGIGAVFECFRSGEIDQDDEVAITYSTDTLASLSEPLVNMRFALAAAVRAGAADAALAERFLRVAKEIYFPQRSTAAVINALRKEVATADLEALAAYLRTSAPDAKREDALALLRRMGADRAAARARAGARG